MKGPHRTATPGAACVYLLLRRDRARFKLGWSRNPLLRPAPRPPQPALDWRLEQDPQSVWLGIEDLLLRLAAGCRITVAGGEVPVLTVHDLKATWDAQLLPLRAVAVDAERWQCWRDGRPLSFVQTLDWEGDDLVLRFMPLRCVERWEEGGPELAMCMRGLMTRLGLPAQPA